MLAYLFYLCICYSDQHLELLDNKENDRYYYNRVPPTSTAATATAEAHEIIADERQTYRLHREQPDDNYDDVFHRTDGHESDEVVVITVIDPLPPPPLRKVTQPLSSETCWCSIKGGTAIAATSSTTTTEATIVTTTSYGFSPTLPVVALIPMSQWCSFPADDNNNHNSTSTATLLLLSCVSSSTEEINDLTVVCDHYDDDELTRNTAAVEVLDLKKAQDLNEEKREKVEDLKEKRASLNRHSKHGRDISDSRSEGKAAAAAVKTDRPVIPFLVGQSSTTTQDNDDNNTNNELLVVSVSATAKNDNIQRTLFINARSSDSDDGGDGEHHNLPVITTTTHMVTPTVTKNSSRIDQYGSISSSHQQKNCSDFVGLLHHNIEYNDRAEVIDSHNNKNSTINLAKNYHKTATQSSPTSSFSEFNVQPNHCAQSSTFAVTEEEGSFTTPTIPTPTSALSSSTVFTSSDQQKEQFSLIFRSTTLTTGATNTATNTDLTCPSVFGLFERQNTTNNCSTSSSSSSSSSSLSEKHYSQTENSVPPQIVERFIVQIKSFICDRCIANNKNTNLITKKRFIKFNFFHIHVICHFHKLSFH